MASLSRKIVHKLPGVYAAATGSTHNLRYRRQEHFSTAKPEFELELEHFQ